MAEWEDVAHAARQSQGRIIPSFGVHPWYMDEGQDALSSPIIALLEEFPRSGLGECGLDKSRHAAATLEQQKQLLHAHISLAKRYDRVLSLHCVQAWGSLLEILEDTSPPRILLHDWRGHPDMIARFAQKGACFSLGVRALEDPEADWIAQIPADRLLLETDEGGDSLEPLFDRLTRLRSESNLREQLRENFTRLFEL